jgi:hypothetical protein
MEYGIGTVCEVNGEKRDIWITFEVASYSKGYAGDYYNPPEGPQYEFNMISVEFDPNEESVPQDIKDQIEEWFLNSDEAYYKCFETVEDSFCEDY